jgi:hypothetical protein
MRPELHDEDYAYPARNVWSFVPLVSHDEGYATIVASHEPSHLGDLLERSYRDHETVTLSLPLPTPTGLPNPVLRGTGTVTGVTALDGDLSQYEFAIRRFDVYATRFMN